MSQRAPAPEHVALLRARAQGLAAVPRLRGEREVTGSITFRLGGQRYALDARVIEEVTPLRNLTPLPHTAAPLLGLTHWRGGVLPVLDLRPALGLDVRALSDLSRLIVIEGARQDFGFVADALEGMTEIRADHLTDPDTGRSESGDSIVQGIADDGTLVLDSAAILRWGTMRK